MLTSLLAATALAAVAAVGAYAADSPRFDAVWARVDKILGTDFSGETR